MGSVPASSFVTIAMAALAIVVAMAINLAIWEVARPLWARVLGTLILAGLMVSQYETAAWGMLRDWNQRPPLVMILVWVALAVVLVVAFSRFGLMLATELPLVALVGFQAFRLPLELTMHRAAVEGVMPVQMSYSGYNYDIVTGAAALVLAVVMAFRKIPLAWVKLWNALGFLLLLNIVLIAVVSLPMFAAFGKDRLNTWIAEAPFVWLPGLLVPAALFGHILVWRKLRIPKN